MKSNNSYNFRYANLLEVPSVRTTNFGKKSFRYTAPVLWNSLPESFRKETNFNQFKKLILNWNGNDCKCACYNVDKITKFFFLANSFNLN